MRVLLQRVKEASVTVSEKTCGKIESGLLAFFAVHKEDTLEKSPWLVNKIVNLRIFTDENGKMNKNILDVDGNILVVSQFTLYGNCANGHRPDFKDSALPEPAFLLYEKFLQELSTQLGKSVQTGIFGAKMEVSCINDGPVTFLLER